MPNKKSFCGWVIVFLFVSACTPSPPAEITMFEADITTVTPGQAVTLTMRALNARTCRLEAEPEGLAPTEEQVPCAGTVTVTPQVTTRYRFGARVDGDYLTRNLVVVVDPPASLLTVTVEGHGTVTSDPVGIDCGSDCSEP